MVSALLLQAQSPNAINYQAVARGSGGQLIVNQTIGLQISILDGGASGTELYRERHFIATNQLGLFSLQIGTGSVQAGAFGTINWSTGSKFLKLELDPAGGTNFILMNNNQIVSVPYSLYANSAGTLSGSATISPSQITSGGAASSQVMMWNGTNWVPGTVTTTQSTDATLEGDGSISDPLKIAQQSATTGQVLMWNGSTWQPGTVTTTQNTDATISGNGSSGDPLKIAQQGASTNQVLKWNGTTWVPSDDNNDGGDITSVIAGSGLTGGGTSGSVVLNAVDQSASNEIQVLSRSNDTLFLTSGGFVILPNDSAKFWKTSGNLGTSGSGFLGTKDANDLVIGTKNLEVMRIDTFGRVGIGTSNPGELLDVNGKIKTGSFQMTTGAQAGRVLTSDGSGNGVWGAVTGRLVAAYTASGAGNNVTSTLAFIGPTVTISVQAGQKVFIVVNRALGSTVSGGANALNLYMALLPSGGSLTTGGGGILNLQCAQNTRQPFEMNWCFSINTTGTYTFGMAGSSTNFANWNSNEYGYITVLVFD